MDNIQKLVIGVLGIAGMLAMLVPSADSVGLSAEAPPPSVVEIPPPAQTADQAQQTQQAESEEVAESELSDDDVFAIGEGAIDGNPVAGSFGNSADAPPPINYDTSAFSQPAAPSSNGGTNNGSNNG
jgi:hypothetical protein